MRNSVFFLPAVLLVLAACGGGSPSAHVQLDPVAAVRHAARATAATSYHATLTTDFAGATPTGVGDYSGTPGKGFVTVSNSDGLDTLKSNVIVDGASVYEHWPRYPEVAPGKTWLMTNFGKYPHPGIVHQGMELARSPMEAFEQLEAARTVTNIGTQTIDGVTTTHYRVSPLDFSQLPSTANSLYLRRPKYGPINVWVGADGYVHRYTLAVTDRGGTGGPLTTKLDFSRFGEAVHHVKVPTARETREVGKGGG